MVRGQMYLNVFKYICNGDIFDTDQDAQYAQK